MKNVIMKNGMWALGLLLVLGVSVAAYGVSGAGEQADSPAADTTARPVTAGSCCADKDSAKACCADKAKGSAKTCCDSKDSEAACCQAKGGQDECSDGKCSGDKSCAKKCEAGAEGECSGDKGCEKEGADCCSKK